MVFLLLLHGDPDMAVRLCRRLAPYPVFVHVDAKALDYPIDRLSSLDHVTVLEQRYPVFWASFGIVDATLALLKRASAAGSFAHVVLLSGACYPVRPLNEFVAFLARDPAVSHIQMVEVTAGSHLATLTARRWRTTPLVPWRALLGRSRLATAERGVRRLLNKGSSFVPRRFATEARVPAVWFGSQWWALTAEAACLVLGVVEEGAPLIRAFRSSFAPDEQFFHTIIGASPLAIRTSGPHEDRGDQTTYDAPLHLIYPTAARDVGNSDADFRLIETSGKFFVRKVNSVRNRDLLARIDTELLLLP